MSLIFYWWNKVCHTNLWELWHTLLIILKADNGQNKSTHVWSSAISTLRFPFLRTQTQPRESRAAKSHMMLEFAYQKMCSNPLFLFVCVNCFWPSARKQASACACCATFPHQNMPPPHSLILSCPWRKTKLACLCNEEQSSERGEELCFHTH